MKDNCSMKDNGEFVIQMPEIQTEKVIVPHGDFYAILEKLMNQSNQSSSHCMFKLVN